MKRFAEISLVIIVLIITGLSIKAQSPKFGHINSESLIEELPEFDSAVDNLEKFRNELISYLELMSVELNNKSDAYSKNSNNLSDIVRKIKEQELVDMNRRIQEFQTNAQNQFQEKQVELFEPIYTKVDKAIKDVGKENGFLYIFNTSQDGTLTYFDESKSTNVTVLVKEKLKLK